MRPMFEEAKKLFGDKPVTGVEVGTSGGENMAEVLKEWKSIEKLYCIDYYPTYIDFRNSEDQELLRSMAIQKIITHVKSHLVIDKSVDAAKKFADGTFDFVYIDANHAYDFVRADVLAWMPKIKNGGIIGGHDYDWCDPENGGEFSVKRAVDEIFGEKLKYHISLFTHDSKSSSNGVYTGLNSDWWVYA